jgi:hypothetical protein
MKTDVAILVLQLMTGEVIREPAFYLDCYQIALTHAAVRSEGGAMQRDGDPSSIWRAHCETPSSLQESLMGSHGPCEDATS